MEWSRRVAVRENMNVMDELARAEEVNAQLRTQRNDRWYPGFHIAAPAGWINDPNGISFFGGRYHVFYQHNPYAAHHANMHWGHVSSTDMVTWRHEPIALAPSLEADLDGVYSGSALEHEGKLYAFYTGHRWFGEEIGSRQVQYLAISEDGITFEKRGVIIDTPEGIQDFRDPKVWKMGETWYMVVAAESLERRGQVWLYTSQNLTDWEYQEILFEDPDPGVFMLECPDFFPLGEHWVLLYGPMGTTPTGYTNRNAHNSGYVVGNWTPGQPFEPLTEYRMLDWGHNFYAPQTFEAPDGRRIVYAWMGHFVSPIPPQLTDGWSGQLTFPRELTLTPDLRVASRRIAELAQLRTETIDVGPLELGAYEDRVILPDGDLLEFELEVDLAHTTAERFGLRVHATPDGAHTLVGYDRTGQHVFIDRRLTGNGDRGCRAAPVNDALRLRVLVDRGSVEVFANDGEEALSSFSFPNEGKCSVAICSEAGTTAVGTLRIHRLRSIWDRDDGGASPPEV